MASPLDMMSSETTEWMVHQKRKVFREGDVPSRVGFYLREPFYSGGLGGRQECTIGGGPTRMGLPTQRESAREVGGNGGLAHSRAGLGMAVGEISFLSGGCEGIPGSSASKNAGFNRSMLTVFSMPFIRSVNTFVDRLRSS